MRSSPKDPLKAEARAMGKLTTIFDSLSPAGRQRVLTWLTSVYGAPKPPLLTVQNMLDLARELRGTTPVTKSPTVQV